MRIFVAGAGGFIGLALCDELIKRGHAVTAFDRWFFGKGPPTECAKMYGDIRTVGEFGPATDAVIDLAGLSNDASGDLDKNLTWDINYEGAKRLALAAKRGGVRRYIYSSSCSVYGHNTRLGLTEADDCKPLTAYAETKVRMEDFLRGQADSGFTPIILRNATVFGISPRMRFDLVVNGMTRAAWKTRNVTIDGDGSQWRPFVHIKDVAKAFVDHLTSLDPQTKNIVGHNHTIRWVGRRVADSTKSMIEHREANADARSYNVRSTIPGKLVADGIDEIWRALETGKLDADDPTAWTVSWYRQFPALTLRQAA